MNILENAKQHYKELIESDLIMIEVPEWGEGDEPAKIYHRPAISLKIQGQISKALESGQDQLYITALILRALNEEGKQIFKMANRTELLRSVDSKVLRRVVDEISKDDLIDMSELSGN